MESAPATEVVASLNAYFSEMDAAIRANGGLVLQFIGDEIEAVFGAPVANARHADQAVNAALDMQARLLAGNAVRRAAGKVEVRHGICTTGRCAFCKACTPRATQFATTCWCTRPAGWSAATRWRSP